MSRDGLVENCSCVFYISAILGSHIRERMDAQAQGMSNNAIIYFLDCSGLGKNLFIK